MSVTFVSRFVDLEHWNDLILGQTYNVRIQSEESYHCSGGYLYPVASFCFWTVWRVSRWCSVHGFTHLAWVATRQKTAMMIGIILIFPGPRSKDHELAHFRRMSSYPDRRKILSFITSSFLALCSGSLYGFGAYSHELANILEGLGNSSGINIEIVGGIGDLGLYLGITMGLFYDHFGSKLTAIMSAISTTISMSRDLWTPSHFCQVSLWWLWHSVDISILQFGWLPSISSLLVNHHTQCTLMPFLQP